MSETIESKATRFMVFAGEAYTPLGGVGDLVAVSFSFQEAIELLTLCVKERKRGIAFYHVLDTETLCLVKWYSPAVNPLAMLGSQLLSVAEMDSDSEAILWENLSPRKTLKSSRSVK